MLDVPDNRKHLPPSPWTEEKIARLKQMHFDGEPYPVIGGELGFSSSAIAGKVLRLGLDKRERAPRRNDGGALVRRLNGKSGHTDRSATQRMASKLRVRSPSNGGVVEVNIFLRDEAPAPANFLCIGLIDLERHHCRFPHGGEDGEPITFCGQKKMDGESYCLAHHRIAYNAPKPRVDRPYIPLGGSKPRVI